MMAADTMEALGIERGQYVVKVNNRLLLDQVLDGFGFTEEEDADKRLTVLRAVDKLDRLGVDGVRQLLGAGRKDESGDFTKGAELTPDQIRFFENTYFGFISEGRWMVPQTFDRHRPVSDMQADNEGRLFDNLAMARGLLDSFPPGSHGYDGAGRLGEIIVVCEAAGYGSNRIRIDPSVVRGLEYYTGPVYEVELLLETKDEKGRPVRFGSVGGGGRYDGLVSRFRGEPVPATGFSIGVSRLQAALTMLGKLDTKPEFGPVVVTVFDRDRVADYQKMVASLRAEKIRAELYLGNPKNMGNQLKYADRRNSPCVIIQGSDETDDPAGPQVILKDLILGAELAKLEKDRDEYLQKQGEAQTKVRQSALVNEVRKILEKHGVTWK
jgi:histidyl-tRNA synthetase